MSPCAALVGASGLAIQPAGHAASPSGARVLRHKHSAGQLPLDQRALDGQVQAQPQLLGKPARETRNGPWRQPAAARHITLVRMSAAEEAFAGGNEVVAHCGRRSMRAVRDDSDRSTLNSFAPMPGRAAVERHVRFVSGADEQAVRLVGRGLQQPDRAAPWARSFSSGRHVVPASSLRRSSSMSPLTAYTRPGTVG